MGFSRQEYWSGSPFPSPGDLPNSGIKLVSSVSPALQTDSLLAYLASNVNSTRFGGIYFEWVLLFSLCSYLLSDNYYVVVIAAAAAAAVFHLCPLEGIQAVFSSLPNFEGKTV